MYQPPPPYQPPPYQPPPPRRGFLQFGVGGAIVLISMSVLGTLARIHNHKHDADIESKKAQLPAVGSEGTLAKGGTKTALCDVPKNAFHFGWPCHSSAKTLPADSKVRVMKAGMEAGDAVCRYWVQSGPLDHAAGDAPCEWFLPE